MQVKNFKYLESVNDPPNFIQGFTNDQAVNFLRKILKRNYARFFTDHKEEAQKIVDDTFDILQEAARADNDSLETFNNAVERVIDEVFRCNEKNHWFHQGYKLYKSKIKPNSFLSILEPHLVGPRILDFGTGKGYLAKLLISKGYQVGLTDVIDQLPQDLNHLDFRLMPNEVTVPFDSDQFETVIVKAVLHHIERENIKLIFQELKRVARRLVIVEDLPFTDSFITQTISPDNISDELMQQFLFGLTQEQRLIICKIMDYFGNALAQGLYYLNFPFNFHTTQGWEELGQEAGLSLIEVVPAAFFDVGLHTFFQTVLIFENDHYL
ncbi:MAG: hypothetical protein XD95_0536 [Microgenomates bacterium 39_7]|nr:MAG: hypothetical protein XD95_0536 [Microgenomates bacterium 39_7]